MQQAGVGPVTALAFVLNIGPVGRFANSKKVVSYLWLREAGQPVPSACMVGSPASPVVGESPPPN